MKRTILLLLALFTFNNAKSQISGEFDVMYIPDINTYFAGHTILTQGDSITLSQGITAGFGEPDFSSAPGAIKGLYLGHKKMGSGWQIQCDLSVDAICATIGSVNYLNLGDMVYLNNQNGTVDFASDVTWGNQQITLEDAEEVGSLGSGKQAFFNGISSYYPPGPGGMPPPNSIFGYAQNITHLGSGTILIQCNYSFDEICFTVIPKN